MARVGSRCLRPDVPGCGRAWGRATGHRGWWGWAWAVGPPGPTEGAGPTSASAVISGSAPGSVRESSTRAVTVSVRTHRARPSVSARPATDTAPTPKSTTVAPSTLRWAPSGRASGSRGCNWISSTVPSADFQMQPPPRTGSCFGEPGLEPSRSVTSSPGTSAHPSRNSLWSRRSTLGSGTSSRPSTANDITPSTIVNPAITLPISRMTAMPRPSLRRSVSRRSGLCDGDWSPIGFAGASSTPKP